VAAQIKPAICSHKTLRAEVSPTSDDSKQILPKKLDGLTSLRFFAAAMILLFHIASEFKFYDTTFLHFAALWQGVTFFFVLSGFILTYVHPALRSFTDVKRFLFARFARIWPTMALTVLLCLVVHFHGDVNAAGGWTLLIVNIIGLQFARSLNPPSWSISVEYFFYLCFPLLLLFFERRWVPRLLLGLAFAVISVSVETLLQYKSTGTCAAVASPLIVINPFCRLFEFIVGMSVALAYRKYVQQYNPTILVATVVELVAIVGVLTALILPLNWNIPCQLAILEPFRAWLYFGGVAPIYGLLIFLVACERGRLSKLLLSRPFVALGELSFSLYMFHVIVLNWFVSRHEVYFRDWTTWQKAACVALLSLLVARLNCRLVEEPCRNLLASLFNNGIRPTLLEKARREWKLSKLPFASLVATIVLVCFLGFWTGCGQSPFRNFSTSSLNYLISTSGYDKVDVLFGSQFWLRASKQFVDAKGLHVSLVWQATKEQSLTYTNNIDIRDATGRILLHKSYFQDEDSRFVKCGKMWQDILDFPANGIDMSNGATLAVSIADTQGKRLFVQNGLRDVEGHQSLLTISK
jgi:peptidoglycan/LPS O-acetylase OafA/YrhL